MKRSSPVFAAIAFFLLGAGSAMAQVEARPPRGSYQQSCYSISFDGRTLIATCLTRRGTPSSTSLPFANRCRGDIANINGTLICQ